MESVLPSMYPNAESARSKDALNDALRGLEPSNQPNRGVRPWARTSRANKRLETRAMLACRRVLIVTLDHVWTASKRSHLSRRVSRETVAASVDAAVRLAHSL